MVYAEIGIEIDIDLPYEKKYGRDRFIGYR